MKNHPILVAVAVVFFALASISFGNYITRENGPTPAIGSRIASIETYHGETGKDGVKHSYVAFSKELRLDSFDKKAYDTKHPEDRSFVEKAREENVEVVKILTNDPTINISEYCR